MVVYILNPIVALEKKHKFHRSQLPQNSCQSFISMLQQVSILDHELGPFTSRGHQLTLKMTVDELVHACSVTSAIPNSLQPYGLWCARLLCPWGLSRKEYWSGLSCPPPGDLPNPGTELESLMSPALAGRFFTTSATWEALMNWYLYLKYRISIRCNKTLKIKFENCAAL